MKNRSLYPKSAITQAEVIASTGEHCPATGWWSPATSTDNTEVFVAEGSIMPMNTGTPSTWRRVIPTHHPSLSLPLGTRG